MKKTILYSVAALSLFFAASCSQFLDEYSQNLSYIESVDDMNELIVGECFMPRFTDLTATTGSSAAHMSALHLMGDELQEMDIPYDGDNFYTPGNYTNVSIVYYAKAGMHHWTNLPFADQTGEDKGDKEWGAFYHRIAVLNNLLAEIPGFRGQDSKTDTQLNSTEGTCLFLRAWNYFMLANIYGAPYDLDNLNDGASISYKTSPEVETGKFSRNNTGDVYGWIVDDLEKAAELLADGPIVDNAKLYPTQAACYALLSRVYLYMERYDDAIDAARKVEDYQVTDLTTYTPGTSFLRQESPEVIFTQGSYGVSNLYGPNGFGTMSFPEGAVVSTATAPLASGFTIPVNASNPVAVRINASYIVSDELRDAFGYTPPTDAANPSTDKYNANDLRMSAFFALSYAPRPSKVTWGPAATQITKDGQTRYLICRKYHSQLTSTQTPTKDQHKVIEVDPVTKANSNPTNANNGVNISETCTIRYSETLLNRAEAEACDNRLTEAAATMQGFLAKRYKAGFLPAVPTTQNELIDLIRLERRKELCFEGHRWLDLRRYAVNKVRPVSTTITHRYYKNSETGTGAIGNPLRVPGGQYVLQPYSEATRGAWIMALPANVVTFNSPNMPNFTSERNAGVQKIEN